MSGVPDRQSQQGNAQPQQQYQGAYVAGPNGPVVGTFAQAKQAPNYQQHRGYWMVQPGYPQDTMDQNKNCCSCQKGSVCCCGCAASVIDSARAVAIAIIVVGT